MTQTNPKGSFVNFLTCVPPPLPEYLTKTYNLKTITGVPTDEDVKKIHDVIRAVNHLSNVPEMYDPKLSTQLARHLFSVQMAVYRSEYPLSILSLDTTYTPPAIPSHIPISLDPIIGAPSDEQIHSVHRAIHIMESLVNTPFTFDPILSTKLSQHLFNVQFARYLQDSIQVQLTPAPIQTQTTSHEELSYNIPDTPEIEVGASYQREVPEPPAVEPNPYNDIHPESTIQTPVEIATASPENSVRESGVPLLEANCQLNRVEELLKDIRRALVGTHNDMVRCRGSYRYNAMMNERGELPWLNNLPYITASSPTYLSETYTDAQIVGYLRCYNIGGELIENDGTESLKKDSEGAARSLLASFLYHGYHVQ
ncbi:unnamed protein product [Rhizoctonia solani]|uniref:Laminin domain protein n=1 Tax=Rhizoctonia solani TaxID=456999 RepID=A0A8H3AVA3_9AGAM|nr:unnamed protein product [Rhizoctonia solani]